MHSKARSSDGITRWARLAERWRARIASGEWAAGEVVPPELALAREAGVAVGTARQAIGALVAEGLLVRLRGRGTYVASDAAPMPMGRFYRFVEADTPAGEAPGVLPRSTILERATVPVPDAAATALALQPGTPVLRLRRLRSTRAGPLLVETIWLPLPDFGPLGGLEPAHWGDALYPLYLRHCRVAVVRALDGVVSQTRDAVAAGRLGVDPSAPLMCVARTAFDAADRPVEHRITFADAGRVRYLAELR